MMTENVFPVTVKMLLPLHTRLWRHNIDSILSEVSTQSMPLGGPYLQKLRLSPFGAGNMEAFNELDINAVSCAAAQSFR